MTAPTPPTPAVSPVETPEAQPVGDGAGDALQRARAEAKSLRDRLRATEAERDGLQEQLGGAAAVLSSMQLAEAERVAAEHLVDAKDLWHAHSIQDMFDDEFTSMVSERKVIDAAKQLAQSKPHLARPEPVTRPPSDRPIEGLRSGASPAPESSESVSWAGFVRGGA